MPGFDPGIHAISPPVETPLEWIAGSSPAMTSQMKKMPHA
jgi:hypothetical protein